MSNEIPLYEIQKVLGHLQLAAPIRVKNNMGLQRDVHVGAVPINDMLITYAAFCLHTNKKEYLARYALIYIVVKRREPHLIHKNLLVEKLHTLKTIIYDDRQN